MSGAYHWYWYHLTVGPFPRGPQGTALPFKMTLVTDTYTFDPSHASVAASILPHQLGDLVVEVPEFSLQNQYFDRLPPYGWWLKDYMEFADADTSYAVGNLKALVMTIADEPLLYLDHETFPALPTSTLGGAIELPFQSGIFGPTGNQIGEPVFMIETGP